jgi:hypothetical protein
MDDISGGCLCRAVRYRISAAPVVTRVCWCRVCQYLGAGSGTVNLCFPSAALSVTGALRDYSLAADSGNVMHRRFCAVCGSVPARRGRTWSSCAPAAWMILRSRSRG